MTVDLSKFLDLIHLPETQPLANAPNAHAAGVSMAMDLRCGPSRAVRLWQLVSNAIVNDYNVKNDGWSLACNPGLSGTFGAGACAIVAPHRGPRGTLAAGGTITSVTIAAGTPLPAAVGVNQLANRGDGTGFTLRIIGNAAGSSGKIEERIIIGNTAGTTPTIYLSGSPLSFSPILGDGFEFLSGRVYMLGSGLLAGNSFRYLDALTGAVASCSFANLPATVTTDTSMVMLDEQYCPNLPGEGFLLGQGDGGIEAHALVATGSSATTLTGQSAQGDAGVAADEFRNFQIRIVKDAAIPTAVGQRRKITAHTAGVSPVYTVPVWTVTPSSTCQYVIENANQLLAWTTASANTFTYVSDLVGAQAADTWSTSTYAVRPSAMAAGCSSFQPFGNVLDAQKLSRYSHIFSWRGGNVSTLDLLDIAAGANGAWTAAIPYGGSVLVNTGGCGVYESARGYFYMNPVGTNQYNRFDPIHRYMENWGQLRWGPLGAAAAGERMAASCLIQGSAKIPFVYAMTSSQVNMFRWLITR